MKYIFIIYQISQTSCASQASCVFQMSRASPGSSTSPSSHASQVSHIYDEIVIDLEKNFKRRSDAVCSTDYTFSELESSISRGKNAEKISKELEQRIRQYIQDDLEYSKIFEIKITIEKSEGGIKVSVFFIPK